MTSAFLDALGADGPSADNGATWRVVTGFTARRRDA